MTEPGDDLDPSRIHDLGHLELAAKAIVRGFLRGLHRSASRGSSAEFAEHRAYSPGDDLSRLDWRAFARTNRYFLREYEDETNLRAILAIDTSASMGFASRTMSKLAYAKLLAAALGYLLLQQRDAVGWARLGDALGDYTPPRATASHLRAVLAAIDAAGAGGPTRLEEGLARLSDRVPARSMVLLFSDLLDEPAAILRGLGRLREKRCEIIAFRIIDPAELDPPFDGWTLLVDPEAPGREVRVDVRLARATYLARFAAHADELLRDASAAGVDLVDARTDEPFARLLARHIESRSKR